MRDELTGLPDRELLCEHLEVAVARATHEDREVALLHLGLDDFHFVNDSLGRDAGDEVLREAAIRLRDAVPGPNLVARPGSDELCVLIADLRSDATQSVAEAVAGHVAVALREPFTLDGQEFLLTATAGASLFPRDAKEVDDLLRHAETAMREGKGEQRGGLTFYAGGTSDALGRLLLTARLRLALERGEFVLHFQPIFELGTGRIAAVEALIRWRDPARDQLVPPLDFIPVAEHTGLIVPIGAWVIDAVCAQSFVWQEAGIDVPIAFNASLHQFRDPGFVDALRTALVARDVAPASIIVEITESTAMRDPACVEPVLARLRELGVRVAIDDFGAGYSSLGRLRDMAVDVLKLDGAFLPRDAADVRAAQLAGATLDLGTALGLTTVAEGVETEEQRAFLVERGCPQGQGYALARPLPADEVTELLRGQ